REHRGAIGFALATGVSIAAYSAVDRVAVRPVQPWLYCALLAVGATVFTATIVIVGRGTGLIATPPADPGTTATGSLLGLSTRDAAAGVLSLNGTQLTLL